MINPQDWKIVPMPEETETFYSGRVLSSHEYNKLHEGLKPTQMEDKWFVYYKEQRIHFHRSWTGHCIFIAEVEKGDSICIGKVISNKNSEQFGLNDLETKKNMFDQLVDYVIRK